MKFYCNNIDVILVFEIKPRSLIIICQIILYINQVAVKAPEAPIIHHRFHCFIRHYMYIVYRQRKTIFMTSLLIGVEKLSSSCSVQTQGWRGLSVVGEFCGLPSLQHKEPDRELRGWDFRRRTGSTRSPLLHQSHPRTL